MPIANAVSVVLSVLSLHTAGTAGSRAEDYAAMHRAAIIQKGESICGVKFNDLNGNGVRDSGEPGIPGWTITLTGTTSSTTVTDERGNYCFDKLKPGKYTVAEDTRAGWTQTAPSSGTYSFELLADQRNNDLNFGNHATETTRPGSICGSKFNDLNGNGVRDPGELGLPNWQISISGSSSSTVQTDSRGGYCFKNLARGPYTIAEVQQAGWNQTAPATPGFYSVTLVSGQNLAGQDFGNIAGNPSECADTMKTWSPLGSGLNNQVHALAVMGSDLYAGGEFTTAGGVSASRIARWNGSSWSPLGAGVNYVVNALAVMGSNLYAGGQFTTAGGVTVNKIAKWDGTSWSSLGTGVSNPPGWGRWVSALAVIGPDLYAGGFFNSAGGVNANSIAKWNGSSWSALGSGTNEEVLALAVTGGIIYAGGSFTIAGGAPASRVARWNGTSWSTLGAGVNFITQSLTMIGSTLYAGGEFTSAGGNASVRYIAKWDGTSWSQLGGGINSDAYALTSIGSNLYAKGMFTTAGGAPAHNIARWDGTNWFPLGGGINNSGYVSSLAHIGPDLYAGGNFVTAGGVSAHNIAKYSCKGR